MPEENWGADSTCWLTEADKAASQVNGLSSSLPPSQSKTAHSLTPFPPRADVTPLTILLHSHRPAASFRPRAEWDDLMRRLQESHSVTGCNVLPTAESQVAKPAALPLPVWLSSPPPPTGSLGSFCQCFLAIARKTLLLPRI